MRRLLLAAAILGAASTVQAQQSIVPATVSCEQNLEQARAENIALRKQLAQVMFQAAVMEEQSTMFKKQLDAQAAQGKAAEKK